MDLSKRKSLIKAFVTSQFNYCPLIWMFHSRELNNRINRIHEWALRLVYQDKSLSFAEFLEKDNSVTIHQRNLQVLATKIFKLKNGLAPEIMKIVFEIQNPAYNFRPETIHFKRENVKTTHYGIQLVRYLGPKIWDMVPNNIKNRSSLHKFENSIKSWKPNECPCRLCKKYIAQIGFIWFTSTFCNISGQKIKNLYISCIFLFFIYILYLFIAQNGEVSPGFPVLLFFCFVGFFCRLCRFFWRFSQGSALTMHFSGDFLAGELVEIFVFCAVVVTIFCNLLVYLFMYYIIITELTQSKTILENTVEIELQPVALDFKNLSQYSRRSK